MPFLQHCTSRFCRVPAQRKVCFTMYMDKEVKRGYNEYLRLDEGEGKDGMMDVALLAYLS